jgi:hypothetical protein
VTGFTEIGLVIDCRVNVSCELVDLLEVEGKLVKVIDEEELSLVWEKLLKLVELTTALRKIVGTIIITVS